jgi:hypothetical protein
LADPLACDDPIAARRYDYARAAADDGDWAAAAEVFEQAAEQAPGWAPASVPRGAAMLLPAQLAGLSVAFEIYRNGGAFVGAKS